MHLCMKLKKSVKLWVKNLGTKEMHELGHTIIRQRIHLIYDEKQKFAPLSIKLKNSVRLWVRGWYKRNSWTSMRNYMPKNLRTIVQYV